MGVYCETEVFVCVCGEEGGHIAFGVYPVYVLVNSASFLNSSSYEQVNGFCPNLHRNIVGREILVTFT